jgi:hypothetical protein
MSQRPPQVGDQENTSFAILGRDLLNTKSGVELEEEPKAREGEPQALEGEHRFVGHSNEIPQASLADRIRRG